MLRNLSLAFALLAATVPGMYAFSAGAPSGRTGAPGDALCTGCHTSNKENSGPGNVKLTFSGGGSTYTPGEKQRVTITITDPAGQRWGFQLTARASSAPDKTGAGTLAKVDDNTQLLAPSGTIQWMTHTSTGNRRGTSGPVSFEVEWTAPTADMGTVDFYVAGNAANANGAPSGDQIYTSKASLSPAVAGPKPKPAVSDSGVVNGASLKAGIAAGSWFTIFGSNLSSSTRIWRDNEFVNGKLPTALDGTKVTVNGKPAAVYFISPGQINAQAPDDTATGNVNVVVTTEGGDSTPVVASMQQAAPAFFPFDPQGRKYAAAVSASGTYLGPDALFGTALTSRPAKPSEANTAVRHWIRCHQPRRQSG